MPFIRNRLVRVNTGSATGMVDLHLHHLPEPFLGWLLDNRARTKSTLSERSGQKWLTIGERWPFPFSSRFCNSDELITAMDKAGVARAVLSPIPQSLFNWAERSLAMEANRRQNEDLLKVARCFPGRFWVFGSVPVRFEKEMESEMRKLASRGVRGLMVGTDIEGELITAKPFAAFWELAQELDMVVFLHPLLGSGRHLDQYFLSNVLGNPSETALAAAHLILSGLLDRFPRVRILLSHGGGNLPYQIGRLDAAHRHRPEVRNSVPVPPSSYLRRFWFDTVLFNEKSLKFLVDLVGSDRVVLGSDFPFLLSAWPPKDTLDCLRGLPEGAIRDIVRENAYRLLGTPLSG